MRSDFFRFPGSRICRISGVQQLAAAAATTTPACTGYGSDRVDDISHQIGTSGEQKRKRNKTKKKSCEQDGWAENSWFDSPLDYGEKMNSKNKQRKQTEKTDGVAPAGQIPREHVLFFSLK